MIVNGKDVNINFRKAEEIQRKMNPIDALPETLKVEASKKEVKELENFDSDSLMNADFSFQNNNTFLSKEGKINRKEYYQTFQDMSNCNFIHRGLQIIADDCSQKNQEGHTVKINSDDDEIKEILEDLFYNRLNFNKELWSIVYETCKLGDNFYEVIPDSYDKPTMVARIRYLDPTKVNRIEKNGKLAFYTYSTETSDEQNTFNYVNTDLTNDTENKNVVYKLEPWQIIHFRIADKDFYPYGGSLLKSGVKVYNRLQLLEDGMVIYRMARVPERRVFKIPVGNLPKNEALRYVQKIRDSYRTSQVLDERGNIDRKAAALAITQDIFLPVKDNGATTVIDTLQAGNALNNIDDIKYFKDQILWTMNIPPEYLGSSDGNGAGAGGRGSLAMQDIKFARFAERIQYYIEEGLIKLAAIELFFKKKKKDDLKNFKIELTSPSNIKEIMDIEYLNQKMSLISAMMATNLFPSKFILKYVMKMTNKEINDLSFFKSVENNAAAQAAGGMASGGIGGGMTGGIGGAPDMGMQPSLTPDNNAQQPGQQPIDGSENVINQELIVKMFGKDVLLEHKQDIGKLFKALDEYNEEQKILKEVNREEDFNAEILTEMQKAMGIKNVKTTNDEAISLLYENELGGLKYDSHSFSVYSRVKQKGKGKKAEEVLTESEETKTLK
jgi:hypothetical protein